MQKRLKGLQKRCEEILENYPETRNSDTMLYVVYTKVYKPNVAHRTFEDVMLNREVYGLPTMESLGRCRRKIQEAGRFRASEEVTDARYENWKGYRAYALEE